MTRWFESFFKKKTPAIQRPILYISADELRQLINDKLSGKLSKHFNLLISDTEYYCPPLAKAEQTITAGTLKHRQWIANRFDCDDFAHLLKASFIEETYLNEQLRAAYCFGIVWGFIGGKPHAINWMVNSDGRLRFVEPRNDEIFYPRDDFQDIYFMLV